MTTINLESYVSPQLQELIQEANHSIHTAKEKILTAYNYAIENDGLTPKTAAKILREKLDFSDRYIREVLPLEAKELKFANKSTPKNDDHDQAERVPPTTIELQEQHREDSGSDKITEESDFSDKANIKTPPNNLNENETMVDITPLTDNNTEIENFNGDTISSTTTTTTTITTNDELDNQSVSTSSSSKIIGPNEFLSQYDEIEILKQMLYKQRQENRYLINEIRQLRNLDPQSIIVSRENEEEAIEDEKINLSVQNDTERISDEMGELISYDEDKVIEFIEHWDQMKRLFRELVEIELYKTLDESTDETPSIQSAINSVLEYLKGSEFVCPRGLIRKKLKFPDGLARYISQYFIDQKTERYLKIKFRPLLPRTNNDDDTLGFNEWKKELGKTAKQRKEDRRLFLEQHREKTKSLIRQLNQKNEKSDEISNV
jgi:hypothetical protein